MTVLLYDNHRGHDFAADSSVNLTFEQVVVHRQNVHRYDQVIFKGMDTLDVTPTRRYFIRGPVPIALASQIWSTATVIRPAEVRCLASRMLRDVQLHTKLMVALTVLVVLVVAASAYFVIEHKRDRAVQQLNDRATQLANLLGASLAQPLWRWVERSYSQGALAATERWTAILSIVIERPRTEERIRKNPLGIYVNGLSWSKELGAT